VNGGHVHAADALEMLADIPLPAGGILAVALALQMTPLTLAATAI